MTMAVRITVQDPSRSTRFYLLVAGPDRAYRFDVFVPSRPSSAGRGFEPSLDGWCPER